MHATYSGPGHRGRDLGTDAQTSLSIATSLSFSQWDTKTFPNQLRDVVPGSHLTHMIPRTPHQEVI